MKKLVIQKWILFVSTIVCAVCIAASLALRFPYWERYAAFALMGGTLTTSLFFVVRKKLITAEVIIENAIIHTQPAVICAQSNYEKQEAEKFHENFGVYVSCFGILMGSKIIRFGQDGNCNTRLKSVAIGEGYISIDYITYIICYGSKSEESQNIRLLYSKPDKDTLAGIIEKFRHDTGVVPVVA